MYAIAPKAPNGASLMIQPMIVKNRWLRRSTSSNTIGGPLSPALANASPNSTAKKRTWRSAFSAKAETIDTGMILSRNSTVWGSSPLPVLAATASAPFASVSGSMLNPAPGFIRLPMSSPNSSAKVGHDLEVDERLDSDAPHRFQVADVGDPDHNGAEDDRSDQHFDQLDEPVGKGLEIRAEFRPQPADEDTDDDSGDQLHEQGSVPGRLVGESRELAVRQFYGSWHGWER